MSEAWIYCDDDPELAGAAAETVAELGLAPRHIAGNGQPAQDGAARGRAPELALALGPAGMRRVVADERLGDVPLVVALPVEQLDIAAALPPDHELMVLPLRPGELRLRIARVRRRATGAADDDIVRAGQLEVNLATYQVSVDGGPIDLTYMEYELLKFLVTNPRRVFSREALLSRVWRVDYYGGARTVDVHVRRVRAKLGSEHAAKIKTVRGVGYRFER